MKVTVDKMFVLPEAGSLLAFADVVFDGALVVRGFRVMRGKQGALIVSFPREQGKDDKWYDIITVKEEILGMLIVDVVKNYYNKMTSVQVKSSSWSTMNNGVEL